MSTRYVALLRGINVGGKNIIKMAELKACLEAVGFTDVITYIASGNVVFSYGGNLTKAEAAFEAAFDAALDGAFGYKGPTVILPAKDFNQIIKEAPKGFGSQPDKYHSDVIFLKLPSEPKQVLDDVLALKIRDGVDTAAAGSKALYFTRLSAERSKSRMGKITVLPSYKSMTIRSWNTATKLHSLLND